MSVLNNKRVT